MRADAPPTSAFAPLKHRAFAVLWTATVIGNIGLWMRDTASAWAMTEIAPSPVMVAAVQAAATLPIFVFSLPAGALSDIVDRRRLMIVVQSGLALVTLCLALLALWGRLDPVALLLLTLAGGIGNALSGPAWQSIMPELVPRSDLKPAVALNSLGINISRAIGPAVAGATILTAGVAAAYFVDLASYAVVLAALVWWKRDAARPAAPERLGGAMRAGVRYALASVPLRRVLLRAALFFAPASCYWALLPLVAREEIGGGAGGYGILLAAVGTGAVGGALLMPRLRSVIQGEALTVVGTLVTGAATFGLAFATSLPIGAALLALAGAAWIIMLTALNGTAQGVLPDWVRGRGLAVYLTIFSGTMTAGSLIWGQIAALTSLDTALVIAGATCGVAALLGRAIPLPVSDADLTPSHHWPAPMVADGPRPTGGPIMVLIEYRVAAADHGAFAVAAEALGKLRRRDGAYDWGVLADAADPERLTEWFLVGSWEEHLRQHDRITIADREIQERVASLLVGDARPVVRHLVPVGHVTPREAHAHIAGEAGPDTD